jgi:hypothetical protein
LVGFKIKSLAILTIDGVPVDQRPELFQNWIKFIPGIN